MKLIFLHADKHQTIPQVNTINFGGYGHTCPNYPKQQVCEIFAILQGRSEGRSCFFLQMSITVFYKLKQFLTGVTRDA